MEITNERITLGENFDSVVEAEHQERYWYVAKFVTGADVLDVACGSGYGSHFLANAGAKSVSGLDLDSSAVEYATENFKAVNLTYAQGNAENLSMVADRSVDVVVSFETIEHLHNVDAYLNEMLRVLRPGGEYFVSTPERRLHSSVNPLRRRPGNPYHVEEFTARQLRGMLKSAGFEVVDFSGQNYISKTLVYWPIQVFIKGVGHALRWIVGDKWVRDIYNPTREFSVKPAVDYEAYVARYWVVRCRKPAV